jgi:hypothetical protein
MASDEITRSSWPKVESGFSFELPDDGAALDGDLWLEPLAEHGIKSVDFIQRRKAQIWLIEAKCSMPHPDGQSKTPDEVKKSYAEIVEKAACTVQVLLALLAGRSVHPEITLPDWWDESDRTGEWTVVLVVTKAQADWLVGTRNMLREALRPLARTAAISLEPKVINTEMAQKMGLGRRAG